MNLDYTDEQVMLRDAVQRLVAERYPFEARRALMSSPEGWSREVWAQFADLGLLAATFPEEDGGLGGGGVEAMLIGEVLGRALCAEPYLASVILAGAAMRLGGSGVLRKELLPAVASGELVLACALDGERPAARRDGDDWVLQGRARNVVHGDSAGAFLIAVDGPHGGLLLLVRRNAAGLSCRSHRTFDGLRAAELQFERVQVPAREVLAQGSAAAALIERTVQHGVAYIAAEACGLMAMLLDLTVEHLKTRTQFGQPLAQFQALQHRAAEMLVALEQARSMALYAAAMVDAPDAHERRKAFAAVKAVISQGARFVGQNAVQLHGGVGVTEEHRAGWGLKRLTMIDMLFGDADQQAATLAALGGFVEAA